MKTEANIVLIGVLVLTSISFLISLIVCIIEVVRERRWRATLNPKDLLDGEKTLSYCMSRVNLKRSENLRPPIELYIKEMGYVIKPLRFISARDGYTSVAPIKQVCVKRWLSPAKRRFTLAHELMHIIYKPEELINGQQAKDQHSLFRKRSVDEEFRDYMAACLLVAHDDLMNRLNECDYASLSVQKKRAFVYEMSALYNVEVRTIYRRISELYATAQYV